METKMTKEIKLDLLPCINHQIGVYRASKEFFVL